MSATSLKFPCVDPYRGTYLASLVRNSGQSKSSHLIQDTFHMMLCALYLVTYDRGQHPISGEIQPYHWAFFIQIKVEESENLGIKHQLRGMPGGFYYPGPEEVDLNKSYGKNMELEIGQVPADKLSKVHELLKDNWIDNSESPGWNCQDWTLEGVRRLRSEGFLEEIYTTDVVRNWLKEN